MKQHCALVLQMPLSSSSRAQCNLRWGCCCCCARHCCCNKSHAGGL
jgi:hypothetical protein